VPLGCGTDVSECAGPSQCHGSLAHQNTSEFKLLVPPWRERQATLHHQSRQAAPGTTWRPGHRASTRRQRAALRSRASTARGQHPWDTPERSTDKPGALAILGPLEEAAPTLCPREHQAAAENGRPPETPGGPACGRAPGQLRGRWRLTPRRPWCRPRPLRPRHRRRRRRCRPRTIRRVARASATAA